MTRPPIAHQLKCWPAAFAQVLAGDKPYTVRRLDRDFRVGDLVVLREWDPATRKYSGREVGARIRAITTGDPGGLPPGLGVLSLPDFAQVDARALVGSVGLLRDARRDAGRKRP